MNKFNLTLCALMAALIAAPVLSAAGKPTGTLYNVNGGQTRGELRWKNSAKEYEVVTSKGSFTFPEDQVERVAVDPPAELAAAVKKVQSNTSLASAISVLEDIAKDYRHLTYDREATRWLAEAYNKQGNPAKAISACETVIRDDAEAAYMGDMAVAYWDALIKDGKASKLNLLLEKAIASGDTSAAAYALVKRGDAAMARGSARVNCEEALRDGYLRVILLYADNTSNAYAEALYKGAKAFDGMGQGARADKLREQLKAECPSSSWARAK